MNDPAVSDIVTRLRTNRGNRWVDYALIDTPGKTLNDAADEIERLRRAVSALVSVVPSSPVSGGPVVPRSPRDPSAGRAGDDHEPETT